MIEIHIPDEMNPQDWRELVADIFVLSFEWDGLPPSTFRYAVGGSLCRALRANITTGQVGWVEAVPRIAALSKFMKYDPGLSTIFDSIDDESSQSESP